MQLSEDVDLQAVADKCSHFTGADFKAMLYNAQLEAMNEHTTTWKPSNVVNYIICIYNILHGLNHIMDINHIVGSLIPVQSINKPQISHDHLCSSLHFLPFQSAY